MLRRGVVVSVVVVLALVLLPVALYRLADPEQLEIDDAVRRATPGQFVRLTDGYTHFELGGPAADGAEPAASHQHVVVLAGGYSVPYYIWDPTFQALTAAGFRVLRYDYYGRGFSDRPAGPYTDAFYVRQLAELLDSQHITQPVDLAGLSFGGAVATSFADRYPSRVRSLVYIDPAFRAPSVAPPLAKVPLVWNFVAAVFQERWWGNEQSGDFLHPERFPDWPARYGVQVRYKGFRRARLSEIVSNLDVDQHAQLQRVGQHPRPVLVFWGRQDPAVSFDFSAGVMKLLPHGRLVAVDQAGHLPQMEQPDIVNSGLIAFLHQVDHSLP